MIAPWLFVVDVAVAVLVAAVVPAAVACVGRTWPLVGQGRACAQMKPTRWSGQRCPSCAGETRKKSCSRHW